jgi:Raf kinase inhibitor-like YbhB/YbcL family protein
MTGGIVRMRKYLAIGVAVVASVLAPSVVVAADPVPQLFTLTSPAFADDAILPLKYAGGELCGKDSRGGNVSPPLAWSNPPAGTKSFGIVMVDLDGRRGLGSVHWVAYGIAATQTGLKEGDGNTPSPAGIIDGKNSRGTLGYTGPCGPPIDAPHHYVIDVLALDLAPNALQAGLDHDKFMYAIVGHSLGPASLVVRYRREP